ncbi:hypothetical protein [Larkinella soli]|uniref:hypothetical protein n=1 Tax=Larkinella soli TaxID=1770527 RepID=UPI000FFC5A43|nr:hypothetical protein [Larkinella soli]
MATLASRLSDLITAVGGDIKTAFTRIGTLADLDTTDKDSLVDAINEVLGVAEAASGGGTSINDAVENSTTQTWSNSKIRAEIDEAKSDAKNEILGGVGTAYDTLAEIATALQANDTADAALVTAVGNRVRHDVNNQGLNSTQKQNARTNIDAYGSVEIGNPDTDLVALYNTAKA